MNKKMINNFSDLDKGSFGFGFIVGMLVISILLGVSLLVG